MTHISDETDLLDRLVTRLRERQRRYHKIAHVEAVIRSVRELAEHEEISDLGAVIAAAFYHDAIYEPQHPANERASARLARRDLARLGWADERIGEVSSMIEGTATHLDPPDVDAAVLFDADLAILGADGDVYDTYSAAVRDEYRHLDDAEWRAGRPTVLQGFLDRSAIFATATGRDRWETAARANLSREIASLPG
jgi:predicted metal-dependent HD superfamily phosphohydrolase